MQKAYYSIMQYCPDRFRAEAVNLGLVMLSPDPHEVRVELVRRYSRIQKLFGIGGDELKSLKRTASNLKHRIELANGELYTDEDLASFAASRANDLRLTPPRLAKVGDLSMGFDRLFDELVEERSASVMACYSPAEVLPPALSEVFYRLQQDQRIWKPGTITVPIYKRRMEIPYAYKNGVVNLIKPHVFPENRRAETQAATLAINGDLIKKHRINGERHKLVVVSTQETEKQAREIDEHVEPLFKEYGVDLIRPDEAEAFAKEVEKSAH